jgi:hypothetical protein
MSAALEALREYRKEVEKLADEARDATINKGKDALLEGLRMLLSEYDLHNHEITIDGWAPALHINGRHWDSSRCSVKFSSCYSLLRERQFPRGKDPERPPIGEVLYDMAIWIDTNLSTEWNCLIGEKLN